jgi:hypothetical protein
MEHFCPSTASSILSDIYHIRDQYHASFSFNLGENGFIVLLEMGDNVRDLRSTGLAAESGGLPVSCPEYVETLDLGDCQKAYKN